MKSAEIDGLADDFGQFGRFRPDWVPDLAETIPIRACRRIISPQLADRAGCAGIRHWLCSARAGRRRFESFAMTGDQDRAGGQAGARVKDSRQDRLKLALRENLKRRKSQARGRDDAASSEAAHGSLDGGSPDDAGRNEPRR
ncbi:hypothetical protein ACVSQB_23745 [Bradyrhizobium elkanii]